ncbi:GGDEF domain-containing protein [Pseudorhodoferax sp.]|jgi:diguanylate cyclase (GGDEF)-like protein|uniref:GGDEF domain-containing protein n=1 Tax=Pseudorhodoferax sp. TaxID=1993553 RepID=UPI002DD65FA7|nr:GGDEF domain-containing protein [Pseudorhodoferax sp.]
MRQWVDQLADVTGVRDLEQLDLSLVGLLCETLAPRRACVYATVSDGDDTRWYLRASQTPGETLPNSDALTLRMDELPLRAERPLLARCADEQRLCSAPLEQGRTASAFALFDDPGMMGVLLLETEAALSASQLRLVGSLLRFYANFRCLVHDNERDLLTGLYNRKPFDEHFDRALDTVAVPADESAPSSWLAVFDLDHFKRVNDLFGHLVGDEVLLLVGRLLRQSFRFSDKVFRFGGEEFVLLLRGADAEDSLRVLERFRERVATHEFPQVGQMSVSIGYTALKPDDTPHSALERADRAVYAAKEGGRNRVCHFERLVSEGRLAPQEAGGSVDFF